MISLKEFFHIDPQYFVMTFETSNSFVWRPYRAHLVPRGIWHPGCIVIWYGSDHMTVHIRGIVKAVPNKFLAVCDRMLWIFNRYFKMWQNIMNLQQIFQNVTECYESSAHISKCDRSLSAQPLISCDGGLLLHLYSGMSTKIVNI